jgi:hypothetical protein
MVQAEKFKFQKGTLCSPHPIGGRSDEGPDTQSSACGSSGERIAMDAIASGRVSFRQRAVRVVGVSHLPVPQHFLYFFPEPQGQGSFRRGWGWP